jgi:hypothetical protein
MSESAEAREWHRIIRASVRECLETWMLQAQAGSVIMQALETILSRATVPILRQLEERPPELVAALLPSLIRTMLTAFVEVMAEQRRREGVGHDATPLQIIATGQAGDHAQAEPTPTGPFPEEPIAGRPSHRGPRGPRYPVSTR